VVGPLGNETRPSFVIVVVDMVVDADDDDDDDSSSSGGLCISIKKSTLFRNCSTAFGTSFILRINASIGTTLPVDLPRCWTRSNIASVGAVTCMIPILKLG